MENVKLRKLTNEEKQKVIFVVNDLFSEDIPEELTEYDLLMKQKLDEFTLKLLKDDEPSQIDSLLEMCEEYITEKKNEEASFSAFGLLIMYDMWINECSFWPTNNPKLWKEWDELKKRKVKTKI